MKARTAVIAVVTAGAVAGGSIYGAYRYSQSHKDPVKVMPVSTANLAAWFFDEEDEGDSLEGTIFSQDTQTVNLASDQVLEKVYVEQGDLVKVGDPLLEYDMTLTELQHEMELILMERLEMTLEKQEEQLEKIKANPNSAALVTSDVDDSGYDLDDAGGDDDAMTGSADLITDDEEAGTVLADGLDAAAVLASVSDNEIITDNNDGTVSGGTQEDTADLISDDNGTNRDEGNQNGTDQTADLIEDEINGDDNLINDSEDSTSGNQHSSEADASEDLISPDTDNTNGNSSDTETSSEESTGDSVIDDDSGQEDSLIDEIEEESVEEELSTEADDGLIDDGLDEENTYVIDGDVIYVTEDTESTLFDITEFRAIENRLRQQEKEDASQLSAQDISRALTLFRENLSNTPSAAQNTVVTINPDVFGNSRTVNRYVLSDAVDLALNTAFTDSEKTANHKVRLYRAYVNVLYYDLLYRMNEITGIMDEAGVNANTITALQAEQIKEQITGAVDAWYAFKVEWEAVRLLLKNSYGYSDEDLDLIYTAYYRDAMVVWSGVDEDLSNNLDGVLSKLADKLTYEAVIETEEPVTETDNTSGFDTGDFDDGGDFGDADDLSLTQDEIREMIREQEAAIEETQLQIREKAITIRQYERKLDGRIVRATMDGVVKAAGSVDGDGSNDAFIVVSGSEGMYVTMNVNELKRDQLEIGDTVTGTSYETNADFTGVITEISEYPAEEDENSSWYWFYGSDSDNPNASFYPVTAYIRNADELTEGSATVNISTSSGGGDGQIYLENYFVRTDSAGQAYVYIRGDDGLLKKQFVKTGGSLWGTGIEIKSGLRNSDFIAFPYGSSVAEGAETLMVETVEDD